MLTQRWWKIHVEMKLSVLIRCSIVASSVLACASLDGQSLALPEEDIERLWNDPNCERTRGSEQSIDWDEVRQKLHNAPVEQSISVVAPIVGSLHGSADLDFESKMCPFGIIAVYFFFVKFLVESSDQKLGMVLAYMSMLDMASSGVHPHLVDSADWLVKGYRLAALRRAVLRQIRSSNGVGIEIAARPKIYTYDSAIPQIEQLTQGPAFCGKGQWGMEVHIHEWLLASANLVQDPDDADFFFVPAYSICMFEAGFFKMDQLDELYKDLVGGLPYFHRYGGRDHIFTFGSGMSAHVFRSWREVIPDAIFLTPETWLFNDFPYETQPCFNTWKDVTIPGYLHRHEILSLSSQAMPFERREHLAVFLGRTDPSRGPHPSSDESDVRGAIRRLSETGQVFVAQNLSIPDMHGAMGNARFCLVPKGKSAWSLRFYEALFANCIPVVLSDHWELPFEQFLDVTSFVIKWPMSDVGNRMMEHLAAVPTAVAEAYMAKARQNRCWYVYPPLLHEVDVPFHFDELYKLCPSLREVNAFTAVLKILEKKRRVSKPAKLLVMP